MAVKLAVIAAFVGVVGASLPALAQSCDVSAVMVTAPSGSTWCNPGGILLFFPPTDVPAAKSAIKPKKNKQSTKAPLPR